MGEKRRGARKSAADGGESGWIDAPDGYSVALEDGKIACRNAKGKRLSSVPPAVRESEACQGLVALRDWLGAHERECRETVETWMLRSLPIPRGVLEAVWPDPAWRGAIGGAIVAPLDPDGVESTAGFLRGVDPARGAGVVDREGESRWLLDPVLAVPHPILIEDLSDWRELAVELGLSQGIPQILRETWARPSGGDPAAKSVSDFAGGRFAQLLHAMGRARTLGYRVRGGFATCSIWEGGRMVEARFWIGSEYPEAETETGELVWLDSRERSLALKEVGPVAYSEGMRMASAIHAGRKVDGDREGA